MRLPALRIRGRGLQRHDRRLDVTAHQIVERAAHPLVGHVHEIDAGLLLEQLHREMLRAAVPRRGVIELPRMLPGEVEKLAQGLRRQLRIDEQREPAGRDQRDRHEALHRIERELPAERRVGAERGRREEQRVAVRRALRDELGADVAGRAGTVVGDDADLPALAEPSAQGPRQDIRAGPGRVRHDDLDGAARVDARLLGCRHPRKAGGDPRQNDGEGLNGAHGTSSRFSRR
jgi:hypothetical protein